MNREQLSHVLRAAARITGDKDILVIGSQAILASHDEEELPDPATMSLEADLAFFDDPQASKASAVDGAIGELSTFHQSNGYYAQGVEVSTAVLPHGWRARVVPIRTDSSLPAAAYGLESHDLVVSKLVAMREKDLSFAMALLREGLLDVQTLHNRAAMLPAGVAPAVRNNVLRWIASAATSLGLPAPT